MKVPDVHVKLLSDNTTAVHVINNMHSIKSDFCHSIISEILARAEGKNIWATVSYIPGKENYDADAESRKNRINWNRFLTKKFLQKWLHKRNALHKRALYVATGIIIVPNWQTQLWYYILIKLLIDILILLRSRKTPLQHFERSKPHALANKLNLLACKISEKNQEQ